MTPTPSPTPLPGIEFYHDVVVNAPATSGAVIAVLFLIVMVVILRPRQWLLLGSISLILGSLPLAFVNAGWWAFWIYFFMFVMVLGSRLTREGGV